jgi:Flp pilus assembly protein TadD
MSTDTYRELSDSERAAVSAAEDGYRFFERLSFEEALASFRKAAGLWPEQEIYWYDIARTLRETGAYGEALASIEEAIRLNPQEPQFRHARGNIKRSLNDLRGAVDEFKQALELDSSFPAHNNLGLTYLELGELALARDVLEIGLNLTPDDTDLLLNLSSVIYNLDRFAIAALCDQRLTELDPNMTEAWTRLANDYYRLGCYEMAESAVRRAISQGDSSSETCSLLEEILLELGPRQRVERSDRDCLAGHLQSSPGSP